MKRIYVLISCLAAAIFTLAACGSSGETIVSAPSANISQAASTAESADRTSVSAAERSQPEQPPETSPERGAPESETTSAAQQSSESSAVPDTSDPAGESKPEPITAPAPESESAAAPESGSSKILVAYFSATNTTKGVAERIASVLGADLCEITPETPYTAADLDYNSDSSRTTIEMNDPDARPAISGSVNNMDQYGIVFLGYPIWWGEAPRILGTFAESCDFSGKTVVPFCTSGGSGVGSSARDLERLTSGANWLDGTRLRGDVSESDLASWINGLGLDAAA